MSSSRRVMRVLRTGRCTGLQGVLDSLEVTAARLAICSAFLTQFPSQGRTHCRIDGVLTPSEEPASSPTREQKCKSGCDPSVTVLSIPGGSHLAERTNCGRGCRCW